MNRYELKIELLQQKYAPFAAEFDQYVDDRKLMVNMLKQLIEACKAMENMDNVFVRVAFNNAVDEQDEKMERIVTRFTQKVWNGVRWTIKEVG